MILLIVIGIILLIVSFGVKSNASNPFFKFSAPIRFAGLLVIVLGVFSSMFKQIDAGKVGVKSLYGSVQPDVLESGLHLINPLLDVTDFDIQTQITPCLPFTAKALKKVMMPFEFCLMMDWRW